MSIELQTIGKILATILILDSQADAALNSLLSLLDRLLDEHLIRLGVTDKQCR